MFVFVLHCAPCRRSLTHVSIVNVSSHTRVLLLGDVTLHVFRMRERRHSIGFWVYVSTVFYWCWLWYIAMFEWRPGSTTHRAHHLIYNVCVDCQWRQLPMSANVQRRSLWEIFTTYWWLRYCIPCRNIRNYGWTVLLQCIVVVVLNMHTHTHFLFRHLTLWAHL